MHAADFLNNDLQQMKYPVRLTVELGFKGIMNKTQQREKIQLNL